MQFKCNSCNRTFQLTGDEYNYFNGFTECPHCLQFVKITNIELVKPAPVNPVKINKPVEEKEIVEISWKVYYYIYLLLGLIFIGIPGLHLFYAGYRKEAIWFLLSRVFLDSLCLTLIFTCGTYAGCLLYPIYGIFLIITLLRTEDVNGKPMIK